MVAGGLQLSERPLNPIFFHNPLAAPPGTTRLPAEIVRFSCENSADVMELVGLHSRLLLHLFLGTSGGSPARMICQRDDSKSLAAPRSLPRLPRAFPPPLHSICQFAQP